MSRSDHDPELTARDRRLIDAIAEGYRPEPMSAIRQAAFRRSLEERLERRTRSRRMTGFALTAAAAAALLIWVALPQTPGTAPVEVAVRPTEPVAEETARLEPLDDSWATGERLEPEEYLPEDYVVLAGLLELETSEL